MKRKLILLIILSLYFPVRLNALIRSDGSLLSARVRVRVMTDDDPKYVFFKVLSGRYRIEINKSDTVIVSSGETVVLTRYNDKVAVKTRGSDGFAADSVYISASDSKDRFSLGTDAGSVVARTYSGDLQCIADMGTVLFINICDIETYVAGVVKAEGGNGKKAEYFKTQAIIARTYTYRYFSKHLPDRYNLCDDTHCQVFDGITTDTLITKSAIDTRGMVITTADSILINSAFHSNCGGETSPSEYVWPSMQSYLVKVTDPWCLKSKNALWGKVIPSKSWIAMLTRNGYSGSPDSTSVFDFNQPARTRDYVTGSFRLSFSRIRSELDLRSAWFSVRAVGDSIRLTGRGYGHGVGLCQEGAMVMAGKGYSYNDIITFYYPGVSILRINDVKKSEDDKATGKN
jgi:stage II sporulation protein D